MKKIDWDNLGFDINPAVKMFIAQFKNDKWDNGKIVEYDSISLFPSAAVLNYGQGLFEGMKAHRTKDNRVAIFRPYDNAKRLNSGCKRLCMPQLDEEFFVDSVKNLVLENRDYIPPYGKGALYIRPILFGSGPVLGVQPALEYTFVIYMSPVGPYFKGGINGIKLEIRDDFHRAPLYGTGGIKAIGNYATSLYPQELVKNNGCNEVLYLDARTSTYVEEVGAANFFMIKNGVLSTPKLSGSILPGITRDSVLTLGNDRFNLIPQERDISYDELYTADELFCTGTAAVLTPISSIMYRGNEHTIGYGKIGEITKKMYDELKGIQLGEKKDDYGWFYEVK